MIGVLEGWGLDAKGKIMITRYWQLDVYKLAKEGRGRVFQLSKKFPKEEMYSLTDQIRRSSHSVCSHVAEAWGRRPYRADFINKLNMSESEALETQSWLENAVECRYTEKDVAAELFKLYDRIVGALVSMQSHPNQWIIQRGYPPIPQHLTLTVPKSEWLLKSERT